MSGPYTEVILKELKESLTEAREKRRVTINIALTQEVLEKEDAPDPGDIRLLCCSPESISTVGMIISDMKTLLTVSDWSEESALLTQDQSLIRVARDYYNSPSCCTGLRDGRKRRK